jgi:hypothetical protein
MERQLSLKGVAVEIQKGVGQEAVSTIILNEKLPNRSRQLHHWEKKFAPQHAVVVERLMHTILPL